MAAHLRSVLGRPLHVARSPEVGARGAVLTALDVSGNEHDRRAWTHAEAVIDPDPDTMDRYDEGFARHLRHQKAARELWRPPELRPHP